MWEHHWFSATGADQNLFAAFENSHLIDRLNMTDGTHHLMGEPGMHMPEQRGYAWDSSKSNSTNLSRAYLTGSHYGSLFIQDSAQLLFRTCYVAPDPALIPDLSTKNDPFILNDLMRNRQTWIQVYDLKSGEMMAETSVPFHYRILAMEGDTLYPDGGDATSEQSHYLLSVHLSFTEKGSLILNHSSKEGHL